VFLVSFYSLGLFIEECMFWLKRKVNKVCFCGIIWLKLRKLRKLRKI